MQHAGWQSSEENEGKDAADAQPMKQNWNDRMRRKAVFSTSAAAPMDEDASMSEDEEEPGTSDGAHMGELSSDQVDQGSEEEEEEDTEGELLTQDSSHAIYLLNPACKPPGCRSMASTALGRVSNSTAIHIRSIFCCVNDMDRMIVWMLLPSV